jgi:hypothetical protein
MMIRQLQQAAAPGGSCGAARRLGPRRQLALAPPVCSGRDTFLYQLCNPAPEGHDSSADGWRHEEQMLKDYTALLDESNLLPEVRHAPARQPGARMSIVGGGGALHCKPPPP